MLSFMRDQQGGNQNPVSQAQAGTDSTAQAGTQDYLTVSGKTKRTRQSTLAVIVMFVVGLVALGIMVKKSQPRAASAAPAKSEESQIEAAISRLTGVSSEMTNRMDQIVQKFHEFSAVVQVAVDELAKNPFELEAVAQVDGTPSTVSRAEPLPPVPPTQIEVQVQAPPASTSTPGPAGTSNQVAASAAAEEAKRREAEVAKRKEAEQALQQHQQQVKRKAIDLKLQSILQSGTDARCLIDDTLVRVGDRIKGFNVLEIGDTWVHVQWSEPPLPDIKIVLKLSE